MNFDPAKFFKGFAPQKGGFEDSTRDLELEAIIQNVSDGVIIYDTNFRILNLNRSAERIFNITKQEVLGVQIEPGMVQNPHLRTFTEALFPSLAPSINTLSDSGWPKVVSITFEDPHLELKTALNQIFDSQNRVIGFIKIVTDTTRENAILESKSEFLTVSAHQLRTPLTAINWTFESLKTAVSDDPSRRKEEILKLVNEGWKLAKRSLKIIEDLLSAAKIEEGKFGFNFEKTNIVNLVKGIQESAEVIAKEFGIKIFLTAASGAEEVWADKERIGMAVSNILDNAVKYNVKGGGVDITIEPDLGDRGFIRVSISDTGIGIPKGDLPKIFQKFYRSESAERAEPNGSGLGMYITKNIIEAHGGKIHVESREGRGTTFWFTLPVANGTATHH